MLAHDAMRLDMAQSTKESTCRDATTRLTRSRPVDAALKTLRANGNTLTAWQARGGAER